MLGALTALLLGGVTLFRAVWPDPESGGQQPGAAANADSDAASEQVLWEDFQGEAPSGNWSHPKLSTTPSGRKFLGEFGLGKVTLKLKDLPEHETIRVTFDLFIIRSWDGNDGEHGPDVFQLSIDQQSPFFMTTFANASSGIRQSYPHQWESGSESPPRTGAEENGSLGFWWRNRPKDSVYVIVKDLDHEDDDLELHFSALNLGPITDESWGIDNVEVRTLSE